MIHPAAHNRCHDCVYFCPSCFGSNVEFLRVVNILSRPWRKIASGKSVELHPSPLCMTAGVTHRAGSVALAMCWWISVGIWLLFPLSVSQAQRLWAWVTALRPPGHRCRRRTWSLKMHGPFRRICSRTQNTNVIRGTWWCHLVVLAPAPGAFLFNIVQLSFKEIDPAKDTGGHKKTPISMHSKGHRQSVTPYYLRQTRMVLMFPGMKGKKDTWYASNTPLDFLSTNNLHVCGSSCAKSVLMQTPTRS